MIKMYAKTKGFTIAELMIAIVILGILMTTATSVYINFFGSIRNIRAANLVYEEARFTMERVVKEIRNGTLDYEEYFNQSVNFFGMGPNETYGQNYCEYSRQFYDAGADGFFGTVDDQSVGERNVNVAAAIEDPIQKNLFLININGDERTYIKRFEKMSGDQKIGRIGIVKLVGKDYGMDHLSRETSTCPQADPLCDCTGDDGEQDGRIDTWMCSAGFNCKKENKVIPLDGGKRCEGKIDVVTDDSFVDITPASLDIVDLQFIITPKDDPRKAYNDAGVQIQPHVTIRIVARAHKRLTNEFQADKTPNIALESTVSARVYNEIITECNLKECLANQQKACPKSLGVCGGLAPGDPPAQQVCSQAVWPGCSVNDYQTFADNLYGLDIAAPFGPGGKTFFENGSEIASCAANDDACKQRRCSDTQDNDCNGLADGDDPACLIYLCNNGIQDATETCIDVGGICDFIRPKTNAENTDLLCFDGYDNDCNGLADEFDAACVNLICSNGQLDPPINQIGDRLPPFFAPGNFNPKNYLLSGNAAAANSNLNEACPDVGGLCNDLNPLLPNGVKEENALCFDGIDNDCSGKADELDPNCKISICSNGQLDCGLAPANFTPLNILKGYSDPLCNPLKITDLDERCVDAGGLCGGLSGENDLALCTDGVDNDCDGKWDGDQGADSDPNCCPDTDGDRFFSISGICSPKAANVEPPHGAIDCDNANNKIFPGAIEVCDDALYPPAHPLFANEPIDNNCSFANGVHGGANGLDRFDPTCCVDTDGDGYGIPTAYIFFDNAIKSPGGTVLCGFSGANHAGGSETPDCNDIDPGQNPGIAEAGNLCGDGLDNNCNGLFDHIDTNPLSFDPGCCDLNAIEICNDGGNSDENCNGLSGYADHYCIEANGRTFRDTFTSTNYKFNGSTAQWNGNGAITINPPNENQQIAISTALPTSELNHCANITSVTLNVTATLPPPTSITYEVSVDGGGVWNPINPGGTLNFAVQNPALKDLRWKATLNRNGGGVMPTLNDLTLNFICQ